jgi:RNA polymerase sigma-70 factor, ECF subfamily
VIVDDDELLRAASEPLKTFASEARLLGPSRHGLAPVRSRLSSGRHVPLRAYVEIPACRADSKAFRRHDAAMPTRAQTHPSGPTSNRQSSESVGCGPTARAALDAETRRWTEQLQEGHPKYNEALAALHDLVRRVAIFELSRRRRMLFSVSGQEFEDLAEQAADDALVEVLMKLDQFRGLARFTTWVYKFVVYEVASKVANHAWRRQRPSAAELDWDQFASTNLTLPEDQLERRAQLSVLSAAIGELGERQRTVFVAVALNDVPIDVLALELRTNRNAIYKNLFDARRRLRAYMAAAGHPIRDENQAETETARGALGPPC